MKKILSLVLAAMMIFSVLPAAFAAETAVAAEVSEAQAEAIALLNNLGIYKGYENGDLGADDNVERYEMSIFATRFKSGRTDDMIWATTENDSGFTDVVEFDGAADYVLGMISYAAQAGIVNGTGNNKFEPNLNVKYKEAITMVVRALGQNYTAASYPWAYIQFANDNGLLEGIDTSIAPDEYVTRGVIAQLLYNALFAELEDEDGKAIPTVAEKNFGLGNAKVMITATNDLVFEPGDSTVLKNDYIRFAEVDVQNDPIGVDYHAPAAVFGLDAAAGEDDAAVGHLYNVYYMDNFANIVSAESLAVKYENRGYDAIEVSAIREKNYILNSSYKGDYYYYIDVAGVKSQVVDYYTELPNKQGETSDFVGSCEMKVYNDLGVKVSSKYLKAGLIMTSDGQYIYKEGNTQTIVEPYAIYSSIIDAWYGRDYDDIDEDSNTQEWIIYEISDLFETTPARNLGGFNQLSETEAYNAISAYADVTVSDGNHMIVREYRLGQISYTTENRNKPYASGTEKVATFILKSNFDTAGETAEFTADVTGTLAGESTNEYYCDLYLWSGLQKADVPSGSYVLYYVNHVSKELDILEVIGAQTSADDDTYTRKTYIRGMDLANDTITVDNTYDTYYFNYNELAGASIVGKAAHTNATEATEKNYQYLDARFDVPVTIVVVDGKVAHIATDGTASEFVIIDSFVSFEEDGIVVNAYTTAEDGLSQIKIGSYNGWTVGGFDYYYYFISSFVGVNEDYLPFVADELYEVVRIDANGVYDLTDVRAESAYKDKSSPAVTFDNAGLKVNEWGYIEGVNSDWKLGTYNYVLASDSHYWMILDKTTTKTLADGTIVSDPTVYSLNGKLNPVVTFTKDADFYKINGDFVIVIDNVHPNYAADWTLSSTGLLGKTIGYYKYTEIMNYTSNQNYLDQATAYTYSLNLVNMLNGAVEKVQVSNDVLKSVNYNAYKLFDALNDGDIYEVADGVLVSLTPKTIATVADAYTKIYGEYKNSATTDAIGITGQNVTGMNIETMFNLVTDRMDTLFNSTMTGTDVNDKYLTIVFEGKVESLYNQKITAFKADVATSNSSYKALKALLDDDANAYKLYYIIDDVNKTAIAWLDYVGPSTETLTGSVTASYVAEGVSSSSDKTGVAAPGAQPISITLVRDTIANTATLTVLFGSDQVTKAGDTKVKVWVNGEISLTEEIVLTDASLADIEINYTGVTALDNVDEFVIQIDRSSGTEVRYEGSFN